MQCWTIAVTFVKEEIMEALGIFGVETRVIQ